MVFQTLLYRELRTQHQFRFVLQPEDPRLPKKLSLRRISFRIKRAIAPLQSAYTRKNIPIYSRSQPMTSLHLQAEHDYLLDRLNVIKSSGEIAPPNVRIAPDFLTPKAWILNQTTLPMKERHLGKHGSAKYRDWEARIHRRDQIQELEQQLSLLQALMDRQEAAETVFAELAPEIDSGDWVELEGSRYLVRDVGFRYLQLVDDRGTMLRCEISQARLLTKGAG
jgi:hypothetical protein